MQVRQAVEDGPLQVAQEVSHKSQVFVWVFPYVPEGHIAMQEF